MLSSTVKQQMHCDIVCLDSSVFGTSRKCVRTCVSSISRGKQQQGTTVKMQNKKKLHDQKELLKLIERYNK